MLRAAGVPVQSMNVFDIDERLARLHALKSAHTEHHLVNPRFGKLYGEGLADVGGWVRYHLFCPDHIAPKLLNGLSLNFKDIFLMIS